MSTPGLQPELSLWKSSVLRRRLNCPTESEWLRIVDGKLLHIFGPQTAKLREPYVGVFVLSSTRSPWAAERRFLRTGT